MDNFIELSKREIKKMTPQARLEYQRKAKEYYGNLKNQLKNYKAKGLIHPFLLFGVMCMPIRIIKLNEFDWPKDGGPVIFSVNHSNSNDFPVISRLVKKHFFIMADYTMQNDFFVDLLNKLNGCIYIDRKSKKSGENAMNQAIDGINKGYNMVIFPETTWNLLESQPILPRKWGDLKIAQKTKRPIIPIILEYNGSNCFVKFGSLRYVNELDNLKVVDSELYDEMTKLKFDIWESQIYNQKYKEISYDEWLEETIKSYKNFDVEYEMSMIRKSDDYFKENFEHILEVAEKIRPTKEIEKKLQFSKVNYRLKSEE